MFPGQELVHKGQGKGAEAKTLRRPPTHIHCSLLLPTCHGKRWKYLFFCADKGKIPLIIQDKGRLLLIPEPTNPSSEERATEPTEITENLSSDSGPAQLVYLKTPPHRKSTSISRQNLFKTVGKSKPKI